MTATATPRPIVAYALLTAGLLLCLADGLPRWIGAAAALTALPEVLGPYRDHNVAARLRAAAPRLVLVGVACMLLWPLVQGHPPASRDHGIHYFQTRLLASEFLPHGTVSGWSDRFNNGYPFLESYPWLGYLLTAACHLLTFGAVSLRHSYAWGILAVWAVGIGGVAWLASSLTRELDPKSRAIGWAGAAAGLLFLFDAGASRQGGWNYAMFHGVWPQTLSAALWTLSIPLTLRAHHRPSPRRLALAAAVLACSVLAHPFGMLAAATSAGGWFVALLLAGQREGWASGRFKIWGTVHAVAALLASGWVVSFMASAGSMAREPVPWVPLGSLAVDALRGALLSSHLLWSGPLAVIGAFVLVRRGRPLALVVIGTVAILLVLGSHAAITVLRLDLLVSGFKNLQFPRYAIQIKPLLFAIAGVGAGFIVQAMQLGDGDNADAPPPAATRRRRFAVALVLAPLVVSVVEDAGRLATRPVGALDTLHRTPHAEAEANLLAALQAEAKPDQRPRVAFMREGMGGGTYPLFSITDAGADLVIDGHVPTVNFKHRVARRAAGYSALGVTHVIHDRDPAPGEQELTAALEPIGTFGVYQLDRFVDRNPVPLARTYDGAGLPVTSHGRESLDITVSEGPFPKRIVVARAPHVRWTASVNGTTLEPDMIRRVPGVSEMAFDVPGPGTLELRYRRSTTERVATWLSGLLALACLVALGRGSPMSFADRVMPMGRRRIYEAAALIGVTAVVGLAWKRQRAQLRATWAQTASDLDPTAHNGRFVRDLVIDDAVTVTSEPGRFCDGLLGKSALAGCSETSHRPHASMLHHEPFLFRCIEVSVPPSGTTQLELQATGRLIGMLKRVTGQGRGKHLDYQVGEDTRRVGNQERSFVIDAQGPGATTVKLTNEGTLVERVCVAAAVFSGPSGT